MTRGMHAIRAALLATLAAGLLAACETTTTVNGQAVARDAGGETDPARRAALRLQLAANYYQQRQYPVAIEEVNRALQADPNSAQGYGMLGLIYMDLGDHAQAEANFGRALRIDPENPELNNNYGWFLCRTARERSALEHFQRAASNKMYATPALAWQNAGVCMLRTKDYKSAEGYLRRSFELDAANPVTKFHLAHMYLSTRQLDRATFYFGLLERDVGQTAETAWLGLRLARAGGDVRGERQYADVLRARFPNSPEAAALRRGAFDE